MCTSVCSVHALRNIDSNKGGRVVFSSDARDVAESGDRRAWDYTRVPAIGGAGTTQLTGSALGSRWTACRGSA